jgi:hypothetical protein
MPSRSVCHNFEASRLFHVLLKLVNTESDSLVSNERVQECLVRAKQTRKVIVRYIQASHRCSSLDLFI